MKEVLTLQNGLTPKSRHQVLCRMNRFGNVMRKVEVMKYKIIKFAKNELSLWKKWEITWLSIACFIIISLSVYWNDNLLGIISATSGVICVVCTGKGKLSAYIFGAINTALYAYIAFSANYYGEVMLNALYYFPLQFYGFYVWNRNIDTKTKEVKKRNMSKNHFIFMLLFIFTATVLYGFLLKSINGKLPFFDSFSTVVSVVAMIVSIKRFAEQWILWIVVDIVTVFMWGYTFFVHGTESIATLLMWIVYLLNAVFMYVKWQKEACRTGGIYHEV